MARYRVQTAELREIADRLTAAADASRAVVEHPGVVRGRAQDGGADVLRDAGERFADRWQYGLRVMSADAQRVVDLLRVVADSYDQADAAVAASLSWSGRVLR